MNKVGRLITKVVLHPARAIELILCVLLVVGGLLLVFSSTGGGPPPQTNVGQALANIDNVTAYFGFFYALVGIPGILAASPLIRKKNKLRSLSSFWIFLVYFFTTILTILVQGSLFPTRWLSTFALACIAAICHMRLRWEASDA